MRMILCNISGVLYYHNIYMYKRYSIFGGRWVAAAPLMSPYYVPHQDLCSPAVSADVPQLRATFVEGRIGRFVFQQYKARVRLDRFFYVTLLRFFFFVHILFIFFASESEFGMFEHEPSEGKTRSFNIHLWSTPGLPGGLVTWHSYSPTFNEELPRRYTVSYTVFIRKYSNIYNIYIYTYKIYS